MRVKHLFYTMVATVGLLLSTACSNEDEFSRGNGNEALLSFDVELSGGMQTKAISDGKTAKQLTVHVFDDKGTYLNSLDKTATFNDQLKATVTINLVKGKTYSFLFWASVKDNSPYTIGADGKTITVNYENATANDESRDAFLGVVKNKKVEGSFEENVILKRPFAQLNFLTDDIEKAAAAGLEITETTKSAITISNAATTLNPFTNTVSGEEEVTFTAAAIPGESETYSIDGKSYRYLGTAYFLVDAAGTIADDGKKQATLTSTTLKIDGVQGDGLTVNNVPAQWNYRTNIYGSLLTATGDFNVTIDPDYEGSHDEEVETKQVASVADVEEAIAAGATEVIVTEAPTQNAAITIPKTFDAGNQTTVSISIPETNVKVTVSEGEGSQQAPKEVVVSCPNMSELEINLPNSTVTLKGSFGSITATTADNTLIIPEDVKVSSLTVNKGNVEIYGQFDIQITKAKGYTGTITYFVSTAEQLAAFATKVNAGISFAKDYVKLSNDIDLKNKEWTPIGKNGKPFSGTFDGCNYTISNLYINKPSHNLGLFGFTSGGKIMNFTLHNAYVNGKGKQEVGAVAGTPYTTSYSNIKLTGDVKVEGFSYVGGMFGKNAYVSSDNLTINVNDGSYVKAESDIYRTYVGGLVGFVGEGNHRISNVKSNIDVIGSTCDVGGITGIAHYGNTFENCVCTGNVTLVNANDEGDHLEIGGIAGVWMNSSAGKVTFRNCNFTGTLKSAMNGVDKSDELSENRITGRKYYPNSDAGELIIE